MKGLEPLTITHHGNGRRRMTFEPGEFKKYIQDNLGTNAPIVDDAGNRIGLLPTDAIRDLLENQPSGSEKG